MNQKRSELIKIMQAQIKRKIPEERKRDLKSLKVVSTDENAIFKTFDYAHGSLFA